jgi:hypothetical protein
MAQDARNDDTIASSGRFLDVARLSATSSIVEGVSTK